MAAMSNTGGYPSGVGAVAEVDMRPKRFGLQYAPPSLVIEWLQPSTGKKFIRRIELRGLCPQADPALVVKELREKNGALLCHELANVSQLESLIARLQKQESLKLSATAEAIEKPKRERRKRIVGFSLVARASSRSKEEEIAKAFKDVDVQNRGVLSLEDLLTYFGDYLGFGQAEIFSLFEQHSRIVEGDTRGLTLDAFRLNYTSLNPYMIKHRKNEVVVRKSGSLGGQAFNLDTLEDCEVYACDTTAQVFADECKGCLILIAPCESSVFVRDCEDCVLWIAAQQLRTRNCRNCSFFLYSKTEPIIETSEGLAFAPWTAHYPGCSEQFAKLKFDPQRNFWNALYDFTGKATEANWRILPLQEVVEISIELDDENAAQPDNPCPDVTHELICAEPISSGESCGQGVANVPQTRPQLPTAPPEGAVLADIRRRYRFLDERRAGTVGKAKLTV